MKRVLMAVLGLVAASCATSSLSTYKGASMLPSEVYAQRSELDGMEVIVRAYLVHEPLHYALWDSPEASKVGDWRKCTTLYYPEHLREAVRAENRKLVVVRGQVIRNIRNEKLVQQGICNYSAVQVVEILGH